MFHFSNLMMFAVQFLDLPNAEDSTCVLHRDINEGTLMTAGANIYMHTCGFACRIAPAVPESATSMVALTLFEGS
jgi:hypothetical protein